MGEAARVVVAARSAALQCRALAAGHVYNVYHVSAAHLVHVEAVFAGRQARQRARDLRVPAAAGGAAEVRQLQRPRDVALQPALRPQLRPRHPHHHHHEHHRNQHHHGQDRMLAAASLSSVELWCTWGETNQCWAARCNVAVHNSTHPVLVLHRLLL